MIHKTWQRLPVSVLLFVFGSFVTRVGVSCCGPASGCSLISGTERVHSIVSLLCSELVAKFKADIDGCSLTADVLAEEVLVHPCGQVVVELVGHAVVDLKVAAVFDAGLEVSSIRGLEVVSHLDVHGHAEEALVLGGYGGGLDGVGGGGCIHGAMLDGVGQVHGDLGEMLPA